ncbi:putative phosphohistidine phosphatase, SixA [Pseudodesulfovibrio mercurii]|uniref:Putative phosphohistidine phosphatase, SixA n=1 Tax=Pseudodesulfovibrio mercurii TaxID=641491 RepID=F0JEF7_9BACT|nr:histidine phosphatase family protein [Pseudodesulfovibrio mercurii]EGB13520.1 putative phosphohistidine phosphatase, SixA [Pseudodesulfovibrio mercurii]
MLIHLMQHGACLPKEVNPNQPLSPVGREQVEKSARAAAILGLRFQLVAASSKVRSIQTAEIMAGQTGYPVERIVVTDAVKAMAPTAETINFIREYEGLDSILITGHLPSLALLASAILSPGRHVEVRVENGGLMQLGLEPGKSAGTLNWALTPTQLTVLAGS